MVQQKKGLFSKVNWVRPYYKELQNKLINRMGILIVILIIIAIVMAYMDQAEWAARVLQAIILVVGAIIGSAMSIQMINKHDTAEQNASKKKGR